MRVLPSPPDPDSAADDLACLVLAAGLGSRMRPFTTLVPKPLLTVNNEPLLDRALRHAGRFTPRIAVNVHHLGDQIVDFLDGRDVLVSPEARLLGTAGAVGQLWDWIGERDLLIINSDTWLQTIPDDFVSSWDRERPRLLVTDVGGPSDFGTLRFAGASLLPSRIAQSLSAEPSGLYETVWRPMRADLDLVATDALIFDCGTPEEFLTANLAVNAGLPVIHPGARPGGPVESSVFLEGATSPGGHRSVGEIRDAAGHVYVSPRAGAAT